MTYKGLGVGGGAMNKVRVLPSFTLGVKTVKTPSPLPNTPNIIYTYIIKVIKDIVYKLLYFNKHTAFFELMFKEMGKREDVLGNLYQISTCTYIFFEITKKTLWIRDPDPQSMRILDPDSGSQKPADPCGSGSGSGSTSLVYISNI